VDWRPWGDGRVPDRAHLIGVVSPQGVGTGAFSAVVRYPSAGPRSKGTATPVAHFGNCQ
jgi:hypothetical protein